MSFFLSGTHAHPSFLSLSLSLSPLFLTELFCCCCSLLTFRELVCDMRPLLPGEQRRRERKSHRKKESGEEELARDTQREESSSHTPRTELGLNEFAVANRNAAAGDYLHAALRSDVRRRL
ncbi:unnamed protein product [Lepidochelys kempii]